MSLEKTIQELRELLNRCSFRSPKNRKRKQSSCSTCAHRNSKIRKSWKNVSVKNLLPKKKLETFKNIKNPTEKRKVKIKISKTLKKLILKKLKKSCS